MSSVTKNFSGETAIDDSYCSFLNLGRFNGCILMEIFPECSNTHDTCYLDRNLQTACLIVRVPRGTSEAAAPADTPGDFIWEENLR